MHIDLAAQPQADRSDRRASGNDRSALAARLERRRAAIDDRFNPPKALVATVRYLQIAQRRFGRPDLAIESYHMGIGNLQHVLDALRRRASRCRTRSCTSTPPPTTTRAAYNLLAGFGDDSSLYYWRILGAAQIMRLYRSDRAALTPTRLAAGGLGSSGEVLHPPDRTPAFSDPDALYGAYAEHELVRCRPTPRALGLAYDAGIGAEARRLKVAGDAVPGAASGCARSAGRACGAGADVVGRRAAADRLQRGHRARYQQTLGGADRTATTGYSFTIARRYVNRSQAAAFQAMLDRLQSLNLIAWERFTGVIEVTVASDASHAIVSGP